MSEGPEVKLIAENICRSICGQTIDKIYCRPSIDKEFANKIIGATVKQVETYGKNIVIAFSTGIYLRNHMLMWGKWRIYDRQQFEQGKSEAPPQSKLKRMILLTSKHTTHDPVIKKNGYANDVSNGSTIDVRNDSRVRLMLFTKYKVAVQFNGPILKFSFENPVNLEPIAKLGPDPLRHDFDINDLKNGLHQRMNDNSTTLIVDLLLDQTFVAGIGNKYKSEILFLSKINPFVTIEDIPPKSMKTLLHQIPSVLNIGYRNSGTTKLVHKTVGKTDNNNGNNTRRWSDKHWVFRRGGRPCWKCRTKIITDYKSSARITFLCPKCQQPV
jgi:formamidopyrimidine-DNA glycosylase